MKLKKLRTAKGLSQATLARRAKITCEYVNQLEAARYAPTVGTPARLAKTPACR